MYHIITRILDVSFSLFGLIVTSPILLFIYLKILLDDGSPLFYQKRVGKNKRLFTLVKFRTMSLETSSVASHLVDKKQITKLGIFLRKVKLDELPQLWNVLKGDMSLVGPRPCLENQIELVEYRELKGVFDISPGITGLAQVKNIDMSTPELLANVDKEMIKSLTIRLYFKYIFLTLVGKGQGDVVS